MGFPSQMRFTNPKGYSLTAADTAAHVFPTFATCWVYLYTPTTNVGIVTVSDANQIAGGNLVGGIVLAKGTLFNYAFGPLLNLESLAYQLATANDVLNLLVLG